MVLLFFLNLQMFPGLVFKATMGGACMGGACVDVVFIGGAVMGVVCMGGAFVGVAFLLEYCLFFL